MQTVFDKMNFKSMKIANLLVSAKSEIRNSHYLFTFRFQPEPQRSETEFLPQIATKAAKGQQFNCRMTPNALTQERNQKTSS